MEAGPALVRAIVLARAQAVEQSVSSVHTWASCEPLSLIDSDPWDPCNNVAVISCTDASPQ